MRVSVAKWVPWATTVAILGICVPAQRLRAQQIEDYRSDRILVKPAVPSLEGLHANLKTRVLKRWPKIGNIELVQLPAGVNVRQAIEACRNSGLVEYAEPDYIWQATATYPNDPKFTDQTLWNLHNTGQFGGTADADVDGPEGWDYRYDASKVIVAVIDSGIRYDHQDLAANMWRNLAELNGTPGADDDGNGYIDDIYGINAATGSGNPMDDYGHGTHVAGIIGARGNNGIGVVGVAWNVQLMALKSGGSGGAATSDLVECINYAIAKRAHIINASWGQDSYSDALREAIAAARNHGITFVAAAGNGPKILNSSRYWPACYDVDSVVTVVATTRSDALASYSNWGSAYAHLGAPGGAPPPSTVPRTNGIYSTYHDSTSAYLWNYGTSMAAPHVVGALALMRSYFPFESYVEHKNRLLSSVDPLTSLSGKCQSGGRLSLVNAFALPWPARPCNDAFAKAIEIEQPMNVTRVTAVSDNVNAAKEPGEPNHAGNTGGRSIWFKFTAQYDYRTELTTEGSGFNTLLAVYTGDSVSSLTLVASNTGQCGVSQVGFYPVINTTYRIAVDGYNGAVGTVKLTCRFGVPPTPIVTVNFDPATVQRPAGQFGARIAGPASTQVRVDRSFDLTTWPAGYAIVNLNGNGTYDYLDSSAPTGKAFYRVRFPITDYEDYMGEPPVFRHHSCNAVGYVDVQARSGESMIANPLNALNNTIGGVLTVAHGVPYGSQVFRFNGVGYDSATYDDVQDAWMNGQNNMNGMPFAPGEGLIFRNNTPTQRTITFLGEVPQGYQVNAVNNGWTFRSSIIPQGGLVTGDLLLPMMNGDKVKRMINGSYVEYTFNNGVWSPGEPTVNVGESFWSYKNVGFWWSRNFFVWP